MDRFWFLSVPVSKPRLWPLTSLADRPTCFGEPVTVRCGCTTGTAVHYTWYKKDEKKYEDVVLNNMSDLHLHCGTLHRNSNYYCTATNDISHQQSHIVSAQLLIPGLSSCIYVISMYSKYWLNVEIACVYCLCDVSSRPLKGLITQLECCNLVWGSYKWTFGGVTSSKVQFFYF